MKHSLLSILCTAFLFISCQSNGQDHKNNPKTQETKNKNLETAYFASGCFWCVEAIYESVKGVDKVLSGYSGGHTQNPTYKSSNTGTTGHAEAVAVHYDPSTISFETLIDIYFGSQNPFQINGQGPDHGSQYRSIIFYKNKNQKDIALSKKKAISEAANRTVAAEIKPYEKFWSAEAYHQDYEKRNPNNPYIRNVSIPRLKRFQSKFPTLIKKEH